MPRNTQTSGRAYRYAFVPTTFKGFDPPRPWTLFVVSDDRHVVSSDHLIPEGPDGPAWVISQSLFDEWKMTLDGQCRIFLRVIAEREKLIPFAMGSDHAAAIAKAIEQNKSELEEVAARAWHPDRTMLIRSGERVLEGHQFHGLPRKP